MFVWIDVCLSVGPWDKLPTCQSSNLDFGPKQQVLSCNTLVAHGKYMAEWMDGRMFIHHLMWVQGLPLNRETCISNFSSQIGYSDPGCNNCLHVKREKSVSMTLLLYVTKWINFWQYVSCVQFQGSWKRTRVNLSQRMSTSDSFTKPNIR